MKPFLVTLFICCFVFTGQPACAGRSLPQKIIKAEQALKKTISAPSKARRQIAAAINHLNNKLIRRAAPPQPWQHSVFYIKPSWQMPVAASGFVFQTVYEGKKEIFGLISAHITPLTLKPGEMFDVAFYNGKKPLVVQAQLVLRGSAMRLDAALIKFKETPEFAAFVKPLVLNERKVLPWATLSSVGYARKEPAYAPDRKVRVLNPTLITTTYTLQRHQRAGFCGSPLLNAQGEVVGLHCGSLTEEAWQNQPAILPKGQTIWPIRYHNQRVSLAVPSLLLGDLVRAYHQGGSFKRAVLWDSIPVAEVDINEHIESVAVLYPGEDKQLTASPVSLAGKEPFLNEFNLRETFDHPHIQGIAVVIQSAPTPDKTYTRRTYVTDIKSGLTDVTRETLHL